MPGQPPCPLQYLESKSFSEVLTWLQDALAGRVALPKVVPDEAPDSPILRAERGLANITRNDLREAASTLIRRFVLGEGERDIAYVQALLHLTVGFRLTESPATDLKLLAADAERFGRLPPRLRKSVLFALLDLRVNLPHDFWQNIAAREDGKLAVTAFAGLVRENAALAVPLLPLIRDRGQDADALYVVLRQEAARLSGDQKAALVADIEAASAECRPAVQAALRDWLAEQNMHPIPAVNLLEDALRQRQGSAFQRRPQPARLLKPAEVAKAAA